MSDSENKGITAFCSILLPERFGIFKKHLAPSALT